MSVGIFDLGGKPGLRLHRKVRRHPSAGAAGPRAFTSPTISFCSLRPSLENTRHLKDEHPEVVKRMGPDGRGEPARDVDERERETQDETKDERRE